MPFTKGYIPWNKNKAAPQISAALKGMPKPWVGEANKKLTGEKARHWNGDKVGYMGLHAWIRKQLDSPSLCDHCKSTTEKRYEWANINGEYRRDPKDWIRLCRSCHIIYDRKNGMWGNASKLIKAQKLDRKAG
jgi:hypothetical protein